MFRVCQTIKLVCPPPNNRNIYTRHNMPPANRPRKPHELKQREQNLQRNRQNLQDSILRKFCSEVIPQRANLLIQFSELIRHNKLHLSQLLTVHPLNRVRFSKTPSDTLDKVHSPVLSQYRSSVPHNLTLLALQCIKLH
jgi:hypothetical protein